MTAAISPPADGPVTLRRKTYSGVSHGTLGELYQGPLCGGTLPEIAIVSLPVDKYSWSYYLTSDGTSSYDDSALRERSKCKKAIRLFCARYGRALPPGRWEVFSELDTGKGMASSTADIVATLRCLFNLFAIDYDQRVVVEVLRQIERADTVFLDEFCLYLSGRNQIVRRLGNQVGFYTCFAIEEGSVDTESLGGYLLDHYGRREEAYRECLSGLVAAFDHGNAAAIARYATRSADLAQEVTPKKSYDELVLNRSGFGADGLFVAHTGTIIGYLFRTQPDRSALDELSAFFREAGQQCYFAKCGWRHV